LVGSYQAKHTKATKATRTINFAQVMHFCDVILSLSTLTELSSACFGPFKDFDFEITSGEAKLLPALNAFGRILRL
jgi:hypothetical protein